MTLTHATIPVNPTCPRSGRPLYPAASGGWTTTAPEAAEIPLEPLKPRRPRTVNAPHGTARLTVTISGYSYGAKIIQADEGSGVVRLVRLRKVESGATYHVARLDDGSVTCDCPSHTLDHEGNSHAPMCKHGAALVATGLLPAPVPFGRGL